MDNNNQTIPLIAIASTKGGSGCTTLAINLTALLTTLGQKALLVDLDPNQAACRWSAEIEQDQLPSGFAPLSQIVSCLEHADEPGQSPLADVMRLARAADAKVIVADLSSQMDYRTAAVIRAADLVIVPTSASRLDLHPLNQMIYRLREASRDGARCKVLIVPILEAGQALPAELKALNIPLAPVIARSAAFSQGLAAQGSAAAASMSALVRAVQGSLAAPTPALEVA